MANQSYDYMKRKRANTQNQARSRLTHPVNDIRETKSQKLSGKAIVLGVTGSIAAVETVKLAHELARHGADVWCVMSRPTANIIHPDALEFATGHRVILEITGQTEHISLCGDTKRKADILLIAPCTANTLSKIACGIDDTPVTTFATTAIGSDIPILIVPAMHASMYRHPIVKENMEKLRKYGVTIIEPKIEENKAKMMDVDEIVANVFRRIGKNDMAGKKTLIISGSTEEEIDDVRVITNRSTGKTGIEIAKVVFERGGNVTLLCGASSEKPPRYIQTERFSSVKNLMDTLKKTDLHKYDIIIIPAAISDYTAKKQKGKISSTKKKISLELTQTPKVVDFIRKTSTAYLVGFKAEHGIPEKELIDRAYGRLKDMGMDLIVANDISLTTPDENVVFIIDKTKKTKKVEGKKQKIAEEIIDTIVENVKRIGGGS